MSTKAIAFAITAASVAGAIAVNQPETIPAAPDAKSVTLAGKTWHGSLDEALAIAKEENKPVLHLQMFGKLDDAFC
jgi:hypothetical protein